MFHARRRPAADAEPQEPAPDDGLEPAGDGPDAPDDDGSVLQFLRELPVLLFVAFLLAFLLRTFVVQVFYIPSSSMEPTLQINDRMIVEKITYRLREPRHGEIIVFEGESSDPFADDRGTLSRVANRVGQFLGIVPANARDFVKRVIGLPGDEIRIDDEGHVFVNGIQLDETDYVLPQQRSFGPITVPDGKLFVLGDNRSNSSDSRGGLGFVSRDHVVGRAMVIIWPPSRFDGVGVPDIGDIPDVPPAEDSSAAYQDAA
ncbi:MAG: signal peptidase I [Actinobacteria bacterium]|nr:signal peptidase I [Actinomycetota bacterium]